MRRVAAPGDSGRQHRGRQRVPDHWQRADRRLLQRVLPAVPHRHRLLRQLQVLLSVLTPSTVLDASLIDDMSGLMPCGLPRGTAIIRR